MNLHGSITEFQNAIVKLYLKLEQRFEENGLIRELWGAMAHDVSQQINGLKALPPSFGSQLKKTQGKLLETVTEPIKQQITEKTEDLSLRECFDLTLSLEEPTIMKIYVPIIRSLRENRTNPALNFYITVKAHLVRIMRATESFSGNPIVIQRSILLLQSFEKEIQKPQIETGRLGKKSRSVRPAREKKAAEIQKTASKQTRPLAKRAKIHRDRAKPLIKKVDLQRRRARR